MFNRSVSYFKTRGIGIGLSTAKLLSNAMLGGIHLNSTYGKGTEVGFSVLAHRVSLTINSKDLKAQARSMKETHTLVKMGPIELEQR